MGNTYRLFFLTVCFLGSLLYVSAQQSSAVRQSAGPDSTAGNNDALFSDSGWSYHFQFTGIVQGHPSFKSPYSGQNSQLNDKERAYSVTSTLYLGRKLWKGASLYFNPEMAGGKGVGSTLGIAAFPNGETFRIGNPEPTVYIARIFLRQHITLDKDHYEEISDDANQVKERVSTSRLTLSAGKFSVGDFFDGNNVSHDPRSDFMNWALMSNGAYDYAANTRGYTYGFVAEYVKPGWTLRFATVLEPEYANGPTLDIHYLHTHSENLEFEKRYSLQGHKGAIRLLGYYNVNKAPNYKDAVSAHLNGDTSMLDAIYGKKYGAGKLGFGINADQELSGSANAFLRVGWNDGRNASWAFAEIDNTISGGIRISGKSWRRQADNIGIALLSDGLSGGHRDFLKIGGYGFMIGDGQLPNYGREGVAELFYESKLFTNCWLTLNYQLVGHPAYNKDRGPINLFAARLHIEL
ncbi:MAG TPA: carbohydrate porin [Puia sp.]|nr:carbohydrate porin [Puia sp.]